MEKTKAVNNYIRRYRNNMEKSSKSVTLSVPLANLKNYWLEVYDATITFETKVWVKITKPLSEESAFHVGHTEKGRVVLFTNRDIFGIRN